MNTARIIRRGILVMAVAALCALIALPAYAAYEDSLKGYWKMDEFNLNDNFSGTSLNTNRWTPYTGGGTYSVNNDVTFSGTQVNFNAPTSLTVSGDFDIQVDYSNFQGGNSGSKNASLIVGNNDMSKFLYSIRSKGGLDGGYVRMDYVNGNWYPAASVATSDTSGKLRITRAGSTFTSYAWTGSAWTALSAPSTYQSFSDPVHASLEVWSDNEPFSVHFDNFKVSNQFAADAKGVNTGTAVGATSVAGKTGFGNALNFNGTSDYVSVADNSSIDFERTDSFSLGAWIKTSSSDYQMIFSKQPGAEPYSSYAFFVRDTGVLDFALTSNNATGNLLQVATTETVNDGNWHYVSAIYDGTSRASGVSLYIDGVEETDYYVWNDALTGSTLNSQDLLIGNRTDNLPFNGSMDDVAIWSRALDGNEIDMIYDLGTEKFEWITTGINGADALNMGYTTSELKLLAELYATGETGASETIDDLTWRYLSGDLPGDIGGTTYDYGDTWIYDGKYYLKLGSGLEGAGPVPEPGCAFGLLIGFFVPGFRRLLKRRVRG